METTEALMPRARRDELVVEELPDETLVYDLKDHEAHCLNPTAALAWQQCDGRTTVSEMAGILAQELGLPPDEGIVWLALDRLRRAKLLEDGLDIPGGVASHSRRALVRRLAVIGGLSILLPVVSSISSPLAAAAASMTTTAGCRAFCIGIGLDCADDPDKKCEEAEPGECDCS